MYAKHQMATFVVPSLKNALGHDLEMKSTTSNSRWLHLLFDAAGADCETNGAMYVVGR